MAQGDDEEAAHFLEQFENTSKALAAANAKFGSDVKVEMAMFDIEAFGLAATDLSTTKARVNPTACKRLFSLAGLLTPSGAVSQPCLTSNQSSGLWRKSMSS